METKNLYCVDGERPYIISGWAWPMTPPDIRKGQQWGWDWIELKWNVGGAEV